MFAVSGNGNSEHFEGLSRDTVAGAIAVIFAVSFVAGVTLGLAGYIQSTHAMRALYSPPTPLEIAAYSAPPSILVGGFTTLTLVNSIISGVRRAEHERKIAEAKDLEKAQENMLL